ncbi:MAG TPA: hypothetical protein DCR43_04790 [Bacteroidales bacterium]|nr:MAG: hypothetical protein A2X11_01715 [Bacteroidetes bacterium GWE2_42_24]OFY29719.1 MAG: hypothetical protein A2X09_01460 [Bacteroidetes bacterium GWF2_43_11]HAQ65156.1 hypothetical protein [Bacteroidales bacterium]HBZ65839.1 hypothetical protein [Bacteroidales bacterium]
MDKKQIQEQRMRGYFIEATKNILRSEGVKGISVRSIADVAGYSFATLYNYFRDVRQLIFICVSDFQDECRSGIEQQAAGIPPGKEHLKAVLKGYMEYFTEYPGIFQLFFIEKLTDISDSRVTADQIYGFLDSLCEADWQHIMDQGNLTPEIVAMKKQMANNLTAGILLFYLNRLSPADWQTFSHQANLQIETLI